MEETMSTLAITGYGRSGTMFLARTLNTDPAWTVEHEPVSGFHPCRAVQERFDVGNGLGNYGEVNSWLRLCFTGLYADHKRVILRDPVDILQSTYNRGRVDLPDLVRSLYVLDGLIQSGIRIVSFRRMTTDRGYIIALAEEMSVHLAGEFPMDRCNQSNPCSTVPIDLRTKAERDLAWFYRLYGDLL